MLLDLFNTYRTDAQHIASVLLALAIWRWGASPERWLIGLFIATMVVPVHVFTALGMGNVAFGPFAWLWIGIDLFAAAAFIAIALRANRNYPLWVAGFQLVAIGAHAAHGLIDAVSPFAYVMLSTGPSYCQLALIFCGFVRHVRRTRRFGAYRDWRILRPPMAPFHT
jgi:hypothetical protein